MTARSELLWAMHRAIMAQRGQCELLGDSLVWISAFDGTRSGVFLDLAPILDAVLSRAFELDREARPRLGVEAVIDNLIERVLALEQPHKAARRARL